MRLGLRRTLEKLQRFPIAGFKGAASRQGGEAEGKGRLSLMRTAGPPIG